MPFAGYPDFEACVKANADKKNPEAYCGAIQAAVEKALAKAAADDVWMDEQPWYNNRMMATYISNPMVDLQGDSIGTDVMAKRLSWLAKYGVYTYFHSDFVIGKILGWRIRDGNSEIKVGIHDSEASGNPNHDIVWKEIQRFGTKGASSIRGAITDKEPVCVTPGMCFSKIKDMSVWAVGWVGNQPAHPGATVNEVSAAKGMGETPAWLAKATEAMSKGMQFEELLERCPHCQAVLAKAKDDGIDLETAKANIAKEVVDAARKSLGDSEWNAVYRHCMADRGSGSPADKERCGQMAQAAVDNAQKTSQHDSHASPSGSGKGADNTGDSMAEDASKAGAAPPPGGDAPQQQGQPNLADVIAVVKSIADRVSKLEQSQAGSNPAAKSAEDLAKEKAEKEVADKKAAEEAAKAAEVAKAAEAAKLQNDELRKTLETVKALEATVAKLEGMIGVSKGVHRDPPQAGTPETIDPSKGKTAQEVVALYHARRKS